MRLGEFNVVKDLNNGGDRATTPYGQKEGHGLNCSAGRRGDLGVFVSQTLIRRDLGLQDADLVANGLRRLARFLGADSVDNRRPADFASRREQLADLEPRLLELAESADDVLRELAADALGAFLGDAALQRLLVLAQDTNDRVRATAIGALEGWPDSKAARDLLLASAAGGHWTVRMRASRALWPFAGDDVIETLLEGLLDPDNYVRTASADALRRRDPATYLDRLRRLADHPAPHLLDAAIDLLGEVGAAQDAEFLAKVGGWFNLAHPKFIRDWARAAARRIRKRLAQKA